MRVHDLLTRHALPARQESKNAAPLPTSARQPHTSGIPISIRRLVSLSIALALALGIVIGVAEPVEAHSFLVRTSPSAGARLSAVPGEIVLDFSEPIEGAPNISMRTAGDANIELPFVGTEAGGTRVRANVPDLANAVYLVTWQVIASDGHTTEGEFAFAVGTDLPADAISSAPQADQPISWLDSLTQFEIVAGLAFALGGLLSEVFIWRRRRTVPRAERAPATPAIAVAIIGTLSTLLLILNRAEVLLSPGRWPAALDTRPNQLLLAIGIFTWIALVLARLPSVRATAAIPVAAALALVVWRGHSGDDSRWWSTPVGAAHVIAGGIWAGALLHLTRSASPGHNDRNAIAIAPSARRYSQVARVAVLIALAMGTLIAITRLASISSVWTSAYGRVLLIKLALVATALLLANHARRTGLPAVGERISQLHRAARLETAVVAAVIAASAVLSTTAPSSSVGSFVLGPPPIANATWSADLAGNSMVLVAASDQQLQVRILQPGGQPPTSGRPTITGRQPNGSDIDFTLRNCGAGCEVVQHDWRPGTTTLDVTVPEGEYAGGTAHITIEWPPGPDGSQLLAEAVAATKSATNLTLSESVTSDSAIAGLPGSIELTGADFISQQPFGAGGDDVHQLGDDNALQLVTFTVPASNIWIEMWIDPNSKRITRETIIDPGHRIEHTLMYDS